MAQVEGPAPRKDSSQQGLNDGIYYICKRTGFYSWNCDPARSTLSESTDSLSHTQLGTVVETTLASKARTPAAPAPLD
jgi:hypothetical protein